MKRPPIAITRGITILAAAAVLAACSDLTSATDSGPPAGFARLKATIVDVNGAAVAGANVRVPFGNSQFFGDVTDGSGKVQFDILASDFAGVSPVAVIVSKDRFLSASFFFTSVTDGHTLNVNGTPSDGFRALASNEFVPIGADFLHHVGDGDFSGSANSQLQVATENISLGFTITSWNSSMRSQFHNATITFIARGVQSSLGYNNRVGLFISGTSQTSYVSIGDSPSSGGFGAYSVNVPIPSNFVDGTLSFAVLAGSKGDFDDWEIGQVLVTLRP